jgi:nucleoside-diphosphate kinase
MFSQDSTRYCFLVEWFDLHAQIYRTYQLFYFPSDGSIEMYDIKQHKTFLKRMKSSIQMAELLVGSSIIVNARQLIIRDFGDEFTRKSLSQTMERYKIK